MKKLYLLLYVVVSTTITDTAQYSLGDEGIPLPPQSPDTIQHDNQDNSLRQSLVQRILTALGYEEDEAPVDAVAPPLQEKEMTSQQEYVEEIPPPREPPNEISERYLDEPADDENTLEKLEEKLLRNLREEEKRNEEENENIKIEKKSAETIVKLKTYGINLDIMKKNHPKREFRAGIPSDDDSCNKVTSIPSHYRDPSYMYMPIDGSFYKWMTEVYGIPIIGSGNVRHESLKRACYTIKRMLGCRYDIRYMMYKLYLRVALIGDDEQMTSLPEYSDPNLNQRARGLGPTIKTPMVSAGDDNQRCKPGDRYYDQDILVHEFCHAVEQFGAIHVIPGFQQKLYDAFKKNMRNPKANKRKWGTSYAATNSHEYFAVACQFYFNAFRKGYAYAADFGVKDRPTLRAYDPDITSLLDLTFPCAKGSLDHLVHRCSWKTGDRCSFSSFTKVFDVTQNTRSMCQYLAKSTSIDSAEKCAAYTCYHEGNTFNWKGRTCEAVKCPEPITYKSIIPELAGKLAISQAKGKFNVYMMTKAPVLDLRDEFQQSRPTLCTLENTGTDLCDLSDDEKVEVTGITKDACKARGFCLQRRKCFFPKQTCTDRYLHCPEDLAKFGECERNPNFMFYKCRMSCDICDKVDRLPDEDELKSRCGDHNENCIAWTKAGECSSNPAYMKKYCKLSCPSKPACTAKSPL